MTNISSQELDIATDPMVRKCYNYLSELHSTLWGEFFSIHEHAGRLRAAEWLAVEIEGVLATRATPASPDEG
jgi:hypothetical protein